MSFWRGFITGGIMGTIIGSTINWPRSMPSSRSAVVPLETPGEEFPARSRGIIRRRPQGRY